MELTNKCQICGSPCGDTYRLCKTCNALKSEGKIKECEYCKKFYNVDIGCSCRIESIAYHSEYRRNMKTPLQYRCDDGHFVRSKGEQEIDNWLYSNSYLHAYEPLLLLYSESGELVRKVPDFYIPSRKLYIEYWGIENNAEYLQNREEKEKLYKLNNINYISIEKGEIEYSLDVLTFRIQYDRRKK